MGVQLLSAVLLLACWPGVLVAGGIEFRCDFPQAVENPGFEDGADGSWTVQSNVAAPVIGNNPGNAFNSQWAASFGGSIAATNESITQSVVIPEGFLATLYFRTLMDNVDASALNTYEVRIDGTARYEFDGSQWDAFDGYKELALDLTDLADGAAHSIQFRVTTIAGSSQSMHVDNVVLDLCDTFGGKEGGVSYGQRGAVLDAGGPGLLLADAAAGDAAFDTFGSVGSPITGIRFWGTMTGFLRGFEPCFVPSPFIIEFRANNAGLPGEVLDGPYAVSTYEVELTGHRLPSTFPIYAFELQLPEPVMRRSGFISISMMSPSADCQFSALASLEGDGVAYFGSAALPTMTSNADLAFFLLREQGNHSPLDSDGDGFTDDIEDLYGSDPMSPGSAPFYADADNDADADARDALALFRQLDATPEQVESLDFNHDGRVDAEDAEYLWKWSIGQDGAESIPRPRFIDRDNSGASR